MHRPNFRDQLPELLWEHRRALRLLGAWIVCGALTAAAILTGLLPVEFSAALSDAEPVEAERAYAAPSLWRLPRARPDESATSDSFAPAATPETAAAEEAAENIRISEDDELRWNAVLLVSSWEDCDQITSSEVFDGDDGFRRVRVACANGTSTELDETEIEGANEPGILPEAINLSDTQAIDQCEAKVREGLPVPASLERVSLSTGVDRAPGGNPLVSFDFSAVNGFGFPLALQVLCVFSEQKLAHLQVSPR